MECAGTAEKVADRSAVEDVKARYAMPVVAIADLSDLMSFLKETKDPELSAYQEAISEYRRKYRTGMPSCLSMTQRFTEPVSLSGFR